MVDIGNPRSALWERGFFFSHCLVVYSVATDSVFTE